MNNLKVISTVRPADASWENMIEGEPGPAQGAFAERTFILLAGQQFSHCHATSFESMTADVAWRLAPQAKSAPSVAHLLAALRRAITVLGNPWLEQVAADWAWAWRFCSHPVPGRISTDGRTILMFA